LSSSISGLNISLWKYFIDAHKKKPKKKTRNLYHNINAETNFKIQDFRDNYIIPTPFLTKKELLKYKFDFYSFSKIK
jgi:hypothetical protein